jgi:hypothetical protein
MHGFHPICLTSQGVQGGRAIGLPHVPDLDLWRLKVDDLLPGQVVLHVTPAPLTRVERGTVGGSHMGGTGAGHRIR